MSGYLSPRAITYRTHSLNLIHLELPPSFTACLIDFRFPLNVFPILFLLTRELFMCAVFFLALLASFFLSFFLLLACLILCFLSLYLLFSLMFFFPYISPHLSSLLAVPCCLVSPSDFPVPSFSPPALSQILTWVQLPGSL